MTDLRSVPLRNERSGKGAGHFQPSRRVRKRREYRQIQTEGLRVSLSHFVLIVAARPPAEGTEARLGVTASRKIGGAVQRNRAKRLVKEAFRATRRLFPTDIDLVVIVRTGLGDMKLAEVVAEWEAASSLIARRIEGARRALHAGPAAAKPLRG